MFQYQELVDAVKSLASAENDSDLSHCQQLEACVRRLGFDNYHHFRQSLKHQPSDRIGNISLRLMRKICERRIPSFDCPYFEFRVLPRRGVGFHSGWIGWDKSGGEVRVPRPLDGRATAGPLRKAVRQPVYVIESDKEAAAWRHLWQSSALFPEDLAKRIFPLSFQKKHLVVPDPPYDRIKAEDGYANNIAFD